MSAQNNFENEWESAFEGAEISPPTNVWSNVRAEIASGQAKKQSKSIIYWKWMAAASIIMLIGVGIVSYYSYSTILGDYEILAAQEHVLLREIALLEEEKCQNAEIVMPNQQAALGFTANISKDEYAISIIHDSDLESNKENTSPNNGISRNQLAKTDEAADFSNEIADQNSPLQNAKSILTSQSENIALVSEFNENKNSQAYSTDKENGLRNPSVVQRLNSEILANLNIAIEPRKVPDMLEIIKMQNGGAKVDFRSMWAGLSLGAGSYESNVNRGGESDAFALSNDMVQGVTTDGQEVFLNTGDINQSNTETPAFSYAVSADFGKQIGKRTYLQGGVEYSKYSSGATSNVVTSDANNDSQAFLRYNNSASLDDGVLTTTDAYGLSNNFEYIAVPFKLGYKLLDRKIGISLSSGVATNFFLKNTLKDKSGVNDNVEVTNGQTSPYKPLNFNGLFGAEIFYQWSDHYQLALVPDYRFSIDGVTKSEAFIQSKPTAFFLGFRFKYILK
jgi:hypothetical protein